MSHGELRKETNCLNCDAQVDGRYCKNCGQENLEPKQTFWHLVTHFFNDVTHFDGKFFTTLKSLLTKPGFLTEEYVKGRRMKYLDPVRMYLFVSFAFFLLYLTLKNGTDENIHYSSNPAVVHAIDSVIALNKGKKDFSLSGLNVNGKNVIWFNFGEDYSHGLKHYDSLQKQLSPAKRSEGIDRYMEERITGVAQTYYENPYDFLERVMDKYHHSFSKVFFISMPIFSLILTLLYIRRRKTFFYVSHAIFTLHCYIVAWFFMAVSTILEAVLPEQASILLSASLLIYLGLIVYILIAMLRFYKQNGFKTIFKWLILVSTMMVVLAVINLAIVVNSFFAMASGH